MSIPIIPLAMCRNCEVFICCCLYDSLTDFWEWILGNNQNVTIGHISVPNQQCIVRGQILVTNQNIEVFMLEMGMTVRVLGVTLTVIMCGIVVKI